jgi:hypothetical protein
MGTALRFVVGLAGLLIAGIGVGITAGILHEVLASPSDIDLPAGPLIPTILVLLAGARVGVIGLVGLSAYSLVDPALNVSRRSWWLSAVLSAGTWLALFATLAGTADAIQPMREGVMIFMLPMMLSAAALVISGIVRLFIGGVKRRERLAAK